MSEMLTHDAFSWSPTFSVDNEGALVVVVEWTSEAIKLWIDPLWAVYILSSADSKHTQKTD